MDLRLRRSAGHHVDESAVGAWRARQLLAVDPTDGTPVDGFGKDGRLDLTPPGDHKGSLSVTVPGVVFRDMLILGFSTSESAEAFPGAICAFSALDGSLVWQFDTIPAPGTAGAETWAEGSLAHAGGANVWTGMALDAERALLFAPTGSATPDFYGGKRLGDNLYAPGVYSVDGKQYVVIAAGGGRLGQPSGSEYVAFSLPR